MSKDLIAEARRWIKLHRENSYQREAARIMTVLADALEARQPSEDDGKALEFSELTRLVQAALDCDLDGIDGPMGGSFGCFEHEVDSTEGGYCSHAENIAETLYKAIPALSRAVVPDVVAGGSFSSLANSVPSRENADYAPHSENIKFSATVATPFGSDAVTEQVREVALMSSIYNLFEAHILDNNSSAKVLGAAALDGAPEPDEFTALRRWKLAAEAVLAQVRIQDEPALDFIAKVVALGERVSEFPVEGESK